jgi:hypothetical protein
VWLGGLATGKRWGKHGRASHPTTSTADVPYEELEESRGAAASPSGSLQE